MFPTLDRPPAIHAVYRRPEAAPATVVAWQRAAAARNRLLFVPRAIRSAHTSTLARARADLDAARAAVLADPAALSFLDA